jgi:hypothetical protein
MKPMKPWNKELMFAASLRDMEKNMKPMKPWNKEFCTLWVAALRSGKFRQGEGCLTYRYGNGEHDKDCCLGVACKVAGLVGTDEGNVPTRIQYDGERTVLPSSLAKEIFGELLEDTDIPNGHLSFKNRNGYTIILAELNDEGMSFDKIADIISYEAGL